MISIPLPWPDSSLLLSLPLASQALWLRLVAALLLVGLPVVLLITLYRYELRLVTRLTALVLLLLRLTALVLVAGLVGLQPILARDHGTELPGKVILAVDRSSSMDISDPNYTSVEKLRIARILGLLKDRVSEGLFDAWLADHEQRREPRMVLTDEFAGDADRRRTASEQRQKVHDELIATVDELTRAGLISRLITDQGLLARLQAKHEVEIVGFNREAWELSTEQLGEKNPESSRESMGYTDLRAPLDRALARSGAGQGKLIGVVMFSDGQHNTGAAPASKARELGERKVPIYPVAVGARRGPPDAAIISVRGPEHTVFKDVEAVFDVKFKVASLPAQDFLVELIREGPEKTVLASRQVQHDGQDRVYTESFPLKMDTPGTQTILATIRPILPTTRELRTDNNRMATTVSVADDRAKVLIVDGEVRWETHYLMTALGRDRLVDLETIVFEQPRLNSRLGNDERKKMGLPAQTWPEEPDALAGYQCIILGDVDAANLPLARRMELEKYVADSAGTLIILAGKRAMPLGYGEGPAPGEGDPLRRLLPIENPRALTPEAGFPLTLTPAGRETRFMELDASVSDNDALWAGHPRPWMWAVAGRAKPGATVLAGFLDPRDSRSTPSERERESAIFARQNYGFGRVLYVGIDGTWRWRYKVGDLYHHRFWGQVVRWAAADRPLVVGNQFVRFGTPQPVYRPGEPVEVVARLADSLGKLRTDLVAGARVLKLDEGKDGERPVALAPLDRRSGQPRVLESKLRDLPPGRYAVELAIPELADKLMGPGKGDQPAKPLRASFTMLPPESKENIDVELNQPLLDDLASSSGGRVFAPWEIGDLESLLLRQGITHIEHSEQKLWQWWGFLAIVVALLTLEWGLRKTAGLP
ncbi:MAG: hypothetical protein U0840_12230 [Gemmataceae bacterium]